MARKWSIPTWWFLVGGPCLGLLVVGFFPWWVDWHFSSWEAVGYRCNLWVALKNVPLCISEADGAEDLWFLEQGNATLAGLATSVGLAVAVVIAWARHRRGRLVMRAAP